MAAPREYESVTVTILREDGTTRKKYEHPVSVVLDYDPHGLSCKLRNGSRVLVDIPVDTKTECCRVGVKSYLFASPEEDLLLTFQGDSDARKFHNHIFKMRQGKEVSVFNERTDESSATQYFQFYSYLSQQQNMMQDYIRTGTYQRAILSNLADFKDKVVLDVGAGSGILSFFAAQAGARRVYAVEASSMAQHAESLVRNNNLQNTIKVIAGKIEEIDINENVDMIISEPMGYMLYNERMLETYIHAKKWLNPTGKMFPSRGDLHVAPFSDETLYAEQLTKANFWYQAYFHGVDLSSLREQALKEYFRQPIVDTFDINICLAKSIRHTLDFLQAKEKDLHNIHIPLEFHILKSATVHGLAFWFDVAFLGSKQAIWLSTAPTEPLTHWYQVRCLLERPIFVKEGQLLRGTVDLIANRRQSYDVKMELRVEGTDTMSTNTLDLKNPYFRYTGIAPQPPPGQNTTSPSEDYWAQLDVQGAKEAVNMVNGITVNGLGEVAIEPENSLIHLGGTGLQLASAAAVAAAVHPGNLASTGTSGLALQNFNLPTQPAASTTHHSFQPQSSNLGPGRGSGNVSNNFPVNNALMIGDYVTPGSIILPTQGIQLPSNFTSHQQQQQQQQQSQ